MSDKIVTIDCSKDLRFEGSEVSGTVNINTSLAREKNISAIKVSLKGGIHSWAQTSNGTSVYTITAHEALFKIEQIIWTPETSTPDHPYSTISMPFTIIIPDSAENRLPPSMHAGNSARGGRVQYYVHAVAEKEAWYKRNTRVNAPFPFLPLDRTIAPTLRFDNWPGPWSDFDKAIHVRKDALKVFGGQGSVEVNVHLPQVDSLPLFTRIPCQLHVICTSKSMSSPSSTDPSSFDFPRSPSMKDIELGLIQRVKINVQGHKQTFTEKHGLLGGFGTMDNFSDIQTQTTQPTWVPDEEKSGKGHWRETVTYTGYFILRCPPSISTRLLTTETKIEAKIDFPGVGNTWKETIGPLPISSGVAAIPHTNSEKGIHMLDFAVPPSYWDVVDEEEGDHKDVKEKS